MLLSVDDICDTSEEDTEWPLDMTIVVATFASWLEKEFEIAGNKL